MSIALVAALGLGAGMAGGSDAASPFDIYNGFGKPQPTLDTEGPAVPARGSAASVRLSRSGVLTYKLGPFRENVTGEVSFGTVRAVAAKAKRRKLVLGRKSFRATSGKRATVRLKLSAKERRVVRRYRSLRIRARVVATDRNQNDTYRSYFFTLKRPR